ncbi:hypothetical protein [Bosea sp. BK604]|uniref:hypothetical protein n=1 Tax=Bosea sp. BK604 TaxID=2512180 RepID=UPI001044B8EA|nr:hypothetical protein [Bosea sp. BK604]TCR60933.1 hypothetical protein EV560_115158 [Bosea sp. BK604]
MAFAHRHGDVRNCGATTIVSGQGHVTVDGKLWAVEGDQNSHGGGALITSHAWLTINGRGVIVVGDHAAPDALCPIPPHCDPMAVGFSSLVDVA